MRGVNHSEINKLEIIKKLERICKHVCMSLDAEGEPLLFSSIALLTSKGTSKPLCQGCPCGSSRPDFVYRLTSWDSSHTEKN